MMKSNIFACVGLVFLAATAACAAGTGEDQQDNGAASAADELQASQTPSVLVGTFSLKGDVDDMRFHTLTLNADHSFKAVGGCRQTGPGAHCFAITAIQGTWKTKTSAPLAGAPNGLPQIELVDSFNQTSDLFYSLKSDVLSLKNAHEGRATEFDKDLSNLPKLRDNAVCADKFDNTLGFCQHDFVCVAEGPDSNTQRCLPPI
jgi:hypothetical protein